MRGGIFPFSCREGRTVFWLHWHYVKYRLVNGTYNFRPKYWLKTKNASCYLAFACITPFEVNGAHTSMFKGRTWLRELPSLVFCELLFCFIPRKWCHLWKHLTKRRSPFCLCCHQKEVKLSWVKASNRWGKSGIKWSLRSETFLTYPITSMNMWDGWRSPSLPQELTWEKWGDDALFGMIKVVWPWAWSPDSLSGFQCPRGGRRWLCVTLLPPELQDWNIPGKYSASNYLGALVWSKFLAYLCLKGYFGI